MAYVSLYRKYRPSGFDSIVGQQHIVRTLKNSILSGNISHAYLFTGSRGTGKTSTAKIFARAINCQNPCEDGSPCNECEVCKQLNQPSSMDILEIDAASNNGVDEIRELREKIKYPPTCGKYKVYIIDEVHMLSLSAFNALLKTLEEPPEHAVFILATTEAHKIPATILSRCMRFDFRLLSTDELASHLKKIFNDMNRKYQNEAIQLIAEAGDGSVRDMLSIADMCLSYCEDEVTYADALEVLGACSPTLVINLAGDIVDGNIQNALIIMSKITSLGKSVEFLAKDLSKMIRNIIFAKNCANANNILQLPHELYSQVNYYAQRCSNEKLIRAGEIFIGIESELRYSTSPKVALEMAIVKACDVTVSIDTDGILQRLKEIESRVRSNDKSGEMTLNVESVWGYLLNTLQEQRSFAAAYTYASGVDIAQLSIKGNTLYINSQKEGEASGLKYYINDYQRIICERFFDITKVEISVDNSKNIISQGIEQLGDLFGKENIVIKNDSKKE